jgi:outer membrane putative beta-barrel porin/alpha-amylase
MRRAGLALALMVLGGTAAEAADPGKLVLLIPNLYGPAGLVLDSEAVLPDGSTHSAHFNSAFQAEFSQLNIALVSQLASLPLPSPATGYTYAFDPQAGVFVRTTQSFGPILSDRAETIGRGRLSLGVSYQRFTFDTIEGLDLGAVPAVFTHDFPAPGGRDDVVTTMNSLDLKVQQFALFVTYGLASRADISLAVPLVSVDLAAVSDATIQRIGTAANPRIHFYRGPNGEYGNNRVYSSADSASGIGDVLLRGKVTAFKSGANGVALGVDVLLPTGDEEDLLGSGALGIRPFLAVSSVHRVSPHLDVGYQWNGDSVLAGDVRTGAKGSLPNQLVSAFGVDMKLGKRATLILDVLGRHVFDSPRLESVTFQALDGHSTFPSIDFRTDSLTRIDGSAGLKWNPVDRLLIDFNVQFSLNEAGMRDKVSPLIGIEYSF